MEHIIYESDIYSITSIDEIRDSLGSAVSAIDMWFPHVSRNIVIRWGQKEFVTYYDSLIQTTRPDRRGFPEEILRELAILGELHHRLFPQYQTLAGEIVYDVN